VPESPEFNAVSFHPNSYRAFVGSRKDPYIKAIGAKFPMLRIRCDRVSGDGVYF
jgi:hypothetical protein